MNDTTVKAQLEVAKSAIRMLQAWVSTTEAGLAVGRQATPPEVAEAIRFEWVAIANGTSALLRFV